MARESLSRLLPDEAATQAFARALWRALPASTAGWTLLLSGELGAGKSTFARALIHAAGHAGAVPSPTYTLIEPYNLPAGPIYHVDLYRVSSEEELHYLGWDELGTGFRIIEWPERVPALRAAADLELVLAYSGDGRSAILNGLSARGATLVAPLDEAE